MLQLKVVERKKILEKQNYIQWLFTILLLSCEKVSLNLVRFGF